MKFSQMDDFLATFHLAQVPAIYDTDLRAKWRRVSNTGRKERKSS